VTNKHKRGWASWDSESLAFAKKTGLSPHQAPIPLYIKMEQITRERAGKNGEIDNITRGIENNKKIHR